MINNRILHILNEVNEEILTYEGKSMIKDGIIDSFEIINIINELEEAFDIEISASYVIEENFSTAEAIINMVEGILKNTNNN